MSGNIGERWRVLSGSNNWEGLLDPLDSDLRRYVIHYGSMVVPTGEAFINEKVSKNVGLCRYARRNLLVKTGEDKGNPFKYEVTKYFYTPSRISNPTDYNVTPTRADAVLKESNWQGYVAVATDEGKVALGRRDIIIVWRGTMRESEWNQNFTFLLVKAPLIFGEASQARVHSGWYEMYTTINPDSELNNESARDQIRAEVARLVEKYKDEEISITVTGQSLGSALATLNSVDLAVNPVNNDYNIPVTAFLFAGPRVGGVLFKNAFENQSNLRALRVFDINDNVPKLPPVLLGYQDVGIGLGVEGKLSGYLKPDENDSGDASGGGDGNSEATGAFPPGFFKWHDMNLNLHGVDGYQGSQGGFEPQGYFDIPKVNKYGDNLKDEYNVPVKWWNVPNNGMVQQDDGTWILDDHEVDETF